VNLTLFLVPLLIIVVLMVFRDKLPHVARSLHHATREYQQGARQAHADRVDETERVAADRKLPRA
jgi:Sec-independent protein translocase protein TatA